MKVTTQRNTIQTSLVKDALLARGHATNHQLWEAVEPQIPGLTLTCVHRITQRLRRQGLIGCTPNTAGEAMLDANTKPHSHFMCRDCGRLSDIQIDDSTLSSIQTQLSAGVLEDGLFLAGKCSQCIAVTTNHQIKQLG